MAADGRSLGAIGAVHYNKKTRREAVGLKGTLPASARTAQLRQRLQLLAEYPRPESGKGDETARVCYASRRR